MLLYWGQGRTDSQVVVGKEVRHDNDLKLVVFFGPKGQGIRWAQCRRQKDLPNSQGLPSTKHIIKHSLTSPNEGICLKQNTGTQRLSPFFFKPKNEKRCHKMIPSLACGFQVYSTPLPIFPPRLTKPGRLQGFHSAAARHSGGTALRVSPVQRG